MPYALVLLTFILLWAHPAHGQEDAVPCPAQTAAFTRAYGTLLDILRPAGVSLVDPKVLAVAALANDARADLTDCLDAIDAARIAAWPQRLEATAMPVK